MTAIGNDYSFEDVFSRQLQNYARPGDLALCMSVSGSSPNLVRAMRWARDNGLSTVALVGARRGGLADVAEHVLVIPDTHYGRVEDAQMTICHMLCYAFMEATDSLGDGS
jgi:D-sedoheptulose 7-phosphate isomerase